LQPRTEDDSMAYSTMYVFRFMVVSNYHTTTRFTGSHKGHTRVTRTSHKPKNPSVLSLIAEIAFNACCRNRTMTT